MREYIPSHEEFIARLAGDKVHHMTVIQDSGVHRHLQFRSAPFGNWFHLITWPNCLCIHGDMGTYVFARLHDMFQFFRSASGIRINPGYWSEKVEAENGRMGSDGVKQWSDEKFRQNVVEHFRQSWSGENKRGQTACFRALREDVLCYRGEWQCTEAVYHFSFDLEEFEPGASPFTMQDFFERNNEEYTYSFIWCLRAIVWGIGKYDAIDRVVDLDVTG